jgi:hypothetical protein
MAFIGLRFIIKVFYSFIETSRVNPHLTSTVNSALEFRRAFYI